MRTILDIDNTVMQRLLEEAAHRGTTSSQLVEVGLRRVLSDEPCDLDSLPPLPKWRGSGARVDIANRGYLARY